MDLLLLRPLLLLPQPSAPWEAEAALQLQWWWWAQLVLWPQEVTWCEGAAKSQTPTALALLLHLSKRRVVLLMQRLPQQQVLK